LKPGTKFSRISYGEIVSVHTNEITVKNEQGVEWTITPQLVEAEFFTPDQFDSVQEVNRTEMVKAIVENPRIVMAVKFKKQANPKDLVAVVTGLLDDEKGGRKRPGPRTLSKKLKEATEGAKRTMVGRHYGMFVLGRLQFTDMEAAGVPLRQVDPRTVEEATFGNVKYVLKT
jgi:hypothetical protein